MATPDTHAAPAHDAQSATHDAQSATPAAAGATRARSGMVNNFDLLRLFAACQVVWLHATWHLQISFGELGKAFNKVFVHFHGVPIFFVISGFLISKSYERSPTLRAYAKNRFLRVYPGLWVSFAVSLALLWALGVLQRSFIATPIFPMWIAAQLTVGQFYNPSYLRSFGVGVLNGSLWTIPIELGFYVLLPLVYVPLGRLSRAAGDLMLGALALASYTLWYAASTHPGHDTILWLKLLLVTPFPYFHMFLIGVLLHRRFDRVRPLFEGKALVWTVGHIAMSLLTDRLTQGGAITSYPLTLLSNLTLAGWTLSCAFSRRELSERVLRGNDISYGVYIYHMLVVNLFVHEKAVGELRYVFFAAALSMVMAALSWRFVESPALKLKASNRARPEAALGAAS